MSTTPRTDEVATLNDYDRETVPADFARQLETELNEANDTKKALEACLTRYLDREWEKQIAEINAKFAPIERSKLNRLLFGDPKEETP